MEGMRGGGIFVNFDCFNFLIYFFTLFLRFASLYLNGRRKSKDYNDVSSSSNIDSSDLNCSMCSTSDVMQENQPKENDNKSRIQEDSKGTKRKFASRKISTEESATKCSEKRIATRSSSRQSRKQSKCDITIINDAESSQKTMRTNKNKGYQLRKNKESRMNNSGDDDVQIISVTEESSNKTKEMTKKSENDKKAKVYSLRHSSQTSKKQENSSATNTGNFTSIFKCMLGKSIKIG